MKALHNKCGDPVLFVLYRKRVRKNSTQVMNKVSEICRSVTVFREPRKQTTRTKQQKSYSLVTCILADFAVDLSVWLWVYSQNNVTILRIKIWKIGFLGKN